VIDHTALCFYFREVDEAAAPHEGKLACPLEETAQSACF